LFICQRKREHKLGDPSLSREPDGGLGPGTLGSRPELRADAWPAEPPRHP